MIHEMAALAVAVW